MYTYNQSVQVLEHLHWDVLDMFSAGGLERVGRREGGREGGREGNKDERWEEGKEVITKCVVD